ALIVQHISWWHMLPRNPFGTELVTELILSIHFGFIEILFRAPNVVGWQRDVMKADTVMLGRKIKPVKIIDAGHFQHRPDRARRYAAEATRDLLSARRGAAVADDVEVLIDLTRVVRMGFLNQCRQIHDRADKERLEEDATVAMQLVILLTAHPHFD